MQRKVDIYFNKFPPRPIKKLKRRRGSGYIDTIEISLYALAFQYKIEEFNDYKYLSCYSEFPALKYLEPSTNLFRFKDNHPGVSNDSRRENSRVLGQTFCRYFNYYYLDAPYTSHISNYLGKQLGPEFNNVSIKRIKDGDTPDLISAKNNKDIFLSEAKGRRTIVNFTDSQFTKWRKQFTRISVILNKKKISLKGYICEFVLANKSNKLSNSKLLIEDPKTSGELFKESDDLYNLIKCGHYKDLLEKIGIKPIGEALLYKKKFSEIKISLPLFVSKFNSKEYVGIFSRENKEIFSTFMFPFEEEMFRYIKLNSTFFLGLEKSIFLILMDIARGNASEINKVIPAKSEISFNESLLELKDGTIICDPMYIGFKEWARF